ncbi:DUF1868-domain-containing protein [Favolaschia claudopus]|uniref:DUF1868-domain-containing protein n=1 Tax=Favolaschia claudopus TaxID=2862362 RepID=A0AAW0DB73_9AGAR
MSAAKAPGSHFTLRNICLILVVSLGVYCFHYAMTPRLELPNFQEPNPPGVPDKFDAEGNVQHFPGNTVIAHLSHSSELHRSLRRLHDKLKGSHLHHLYALLPPSSWHMTLFEGVLDKVRVPGRWPDDLPLNASLAQCHSLYERKLSSFDLRCAPPYKLSILGFQKQVAGITLDLQPSTPQENSRLRDLRDRLSELLHIRAREHDTYGFHLSLAYKLRYLSEEQDTELTELLMDHFKKEMPNQFELGAPEFCKFEDMFAFEPLLYLKDQQ